MREVIRSALELGVSSGYLTKGYEPKKKWGVLSQEDALQEQLEKNLKENLIHYRAELSKYAHI